MNLDQTISIYAGGPGSGCTGPNCGRKKSWKQKFKEAGVEMPIINYTVPHKSQYEGMVNLELNTSHGQFHQRGETAKEAKHNFLTWYLDKEVAKKGSSAFPDPDEMGPQRQALGQMKVVRKSGNRQLISPTDRAK